MSVFTRQIVAGYWANIYRDTGRLKNYLVDLVLFFFSMFFFIVCHFVTEEVALK